MKKKSLILITFTILFFSLKSIHASPENNDINHIKNQNDSVNIYREKFSDLLLVIHFNHPYYGNIDFLKELYSPVFKHIVFYGEKPDPNVIAVHSRTGHFLSDVLEDVLTQFPHYNGYLILQDDCILNAWNLISLDHDKIWFTLKFNNFWDMNIIHLDNGKQILGSVWPGWQWGNTYLAKTQIAYTHLSQDDINILNANFGKGNVPANLCDFFYIPHRFKESVLRLCPIFKNIFCEIAIPVMLSCLDSTKNWEQLNMLWGIGLGWANTGISNLTKSNYPTNVHWMHPVKLSSQTNRTVTTEIFNEMLSKNQS